MNSKFLLFHFKTVLAFFILFPAVICEYSGFYVDNGIGQTIMEERLPRTETELLRHHMLELLDLPYRDNDERIQPLNNR